MEKETDQFRPYYISLISYFMYAAVEKNIITASQRWQLGQFLREYYDGWYKDGNPGFKLNVAGAPGDMFTVRMGMSQERTAELGAKMDALTKSYEGQIVDMCQVFQQIAAYCVSLEEFLYCTISHCGWLASRGLILCPAAK